MSTPAINIYGIRHHGPGSSRRLVRALATFQPDIILVEGPPDAQDQMGWVQHIAMEPPVALLVYNPDFLQQATFYPFVSYSPEWQALKYGWQNEVPVRWCDLPMSHQFVLRAAEEEARRQQWLFPSEMDSGLNKEQKKIQYDPLGYLAQLAGYADTEQWWEDHFEQSEEEDLFPGILQLMGALRDVSGVPDGETLLREAWMREGIRNAIKEGFQKIAFVCGAWHAPVLLSYSALAKQDKALLKGLKKCKTRSTWVPWNFERLSTESGYGAGVRSPAYYQLIFDDPSAVSQRWLASMARELRREGLNAPTANIIESVHLADLLASMRQRRLPGLEELEEAAVAVLCEGHRSKMELVERTMILGPGLGKLPEGIPKIPLQEDLEQWIKTARLTKEYQSGNLHEKRLDLRVESNLTASVVLHRLSLLGLQFGKPFNSGIQVQGSFSEFWQLKWEPEFALELIEAGMWGSTLEEASVRKTRKALSEEATLGVLAALSDQILKADLAPLLPDLILRLQEIIALQQDVPALMEVIPVLVGNIRYGQIRSIDTSAFHLLLKELVPRVCIGLEAACTGIDEAQAAAMYQKLSKVHHGILVIGDANWMELWFSALMQLANSETVFPLLAGGSARLLYDSRQWSDTKTEQAFYLATSAGAEAVEVARWLEGFLGESGLLLVHQPALTFMMDAWLQQLDEERFAQVLPLMRRSLSKFNAQEKQHLMQMIQQGESAVTGAYEELTFNADIATKAMTAGRLLLG